MECPHRPGTASGLPRGRPPLSPLHRLAHRAQRGRKVDECSPENTPVVGMPPLQPAAPAARADRFASRLRRGGASGDAGCCADGQAVQPPPGDRQLVHAPVVGAARQVAAPAARAAERPDSDVSAGALSRPRLRLPDRRQRTPLVAGQRSRRLHGLRARQLRPRLGKENPQPATRRWARDGHAGGALRLGYADQRGQTVSSPSPRFLCRRGRVCLSRAAGQGSASAGQDYAVLDRTAHTVDRPLRQGTPEAGD